SLVLPLEGPAEGDPSVGHDHSDPMQRHHRIPCERVHECLRDFRVGWNVCLGCPYDEIVRHAVDAIDVEGDTLGIVLVGTGTHIAAECHDARMDGHRDHRVVK